MFLIFNLNVTTTRVKRESRNGQSINFKQVHVYTQNREFNQCDLFPGNWITTWRPAIAGAGERQELGVMVEDDVDLSIYAYR